MVSPHPELQDEQPKENSQWLSDFRIFLRMYWKKGCTTQLSGCYCIMERESKLAFKYLQNSLMLPIALNMSLSCSIFSTFWKAWSRKFTPSTLFDYCSQQSVILFYHPHYSFKETSIFPFRYCNNETRVKIAKPIQTPQTHNWNTHIIVLEVMQ